MDKSARLFIAVPLPTHVRRALSTTVQTLSSRLPSEKIRWVKEENMHLTVRFLGETEPEQYQPLCNAVAALSAKMDPIQLTLNHIGAFPSSNRPRVLWVGMVGDIPAIQALAHQLNEQVELLGWQPDKFKQYNPHLTLGRVKRERKIMLPFPLPDVAPVAFKIDQLIVYESRREPAGIRYIPRFKAPFR